MFAPAIDENGTIEYKQLSDPLHGYCMEVEYMEGSYMPSFSTDHWRDELFYWHENYFDVQPIVGEDRYKYECYHPEDGVYAYPDRILNWYGWIEVETNQWDTSANAKGKKVSQKLKEVLSL